MVSEVKSEKLAQELKDLETRGDDELKTRWRSLYGTKPPQKIHRSLLIAAVAHRSGPGYLNSFPRFISGFRVG